MCILIQQIQNNVEQLETEIIAKNYLEYEKNKQLKS